MYPVVSEGFDEDALFQSGRLSIVNFPSKTPLPPLNPAYRRALKQCNAVGSQGISPVNGRIVV